MNSKSSLYAWASTLGRNFGFRLSLLMLFAVLATVWLTATLGSAAQTDVAYFLEDGQFLRVGNQHLELSFRRDSGALWSVLHKASGVDLITVKDEVFHVAWSATLVNPEGDQVVTDSGRSRRFTYSVIDTADGIELEMTWSDLSLNNKNQYPGSARLIIVIKDDSPFSVWKGRFSNLGDRAVESFSFPGNITGIEHLGTSGDDDFLIVPARIGRLYTDPTRLLTNWAGEYPSGAVSVQFTAFYDDETGFYLAAHDPAGNTKGFTWRMCRGCPGSIWGTSYVAPLQAGQDVTAPYDVVLGVFEGDWYDAADIYRSWAYQQQWADTTLDKSPQWLHDAAIGKDNYSYPTGLVEGRAGLKTYDEVIFNIRGHQDFYDAPTLAMLWGWERGGAWIAGDFFPPMEGWEKFDSLVRAVHEANSRMWLFLTVNHVGVTTDLWNSGEPEPFTVKDRDGKTQTVDFTLGAPDIRAVMDINTPYWQEKLKSFILTLAEHDVDLIQLDGMPISAPLASFDELSGNPDGRGGNWYSQAWIRTIDEARELAKAVKPDVAFAGETIAEVYLPNLDAYQSRDNWAEVKNRELHPSGGAPVPLFQYLYHDRIFSLAHYNLGPFAKRPGYANTYNFLALARTMNWGQLVSYNVQDDLEGPVGDARALEFLKLMTRAREHYAHDFLVSGRMLRPPEIISPTTEIEDRTGDFSGEFPAVQHSAWASADGDYGLIFTNISEDSVSLDVELSAMPWLPSGSYVLYELRDGAFSKVLPVFDPLEALQISVDPLEIVFIGITKPESSKGDAAIALGQSLAAIRDAEEKLTGIDLASSRAFLDAQNAFLVGEYLRVEDLVSETERLTRLALLPTPTPEPTPIPTASPIPTQAPTPTAVQQPTATMTRSSTPAPTPASTHSPTATSSGPAVVTPAPKLTPTHTPAPTSGGGCNAAVGGGTRISIGLLLIGLIWPARKVAKLRERSRPESWG